VEERGKANTVKLARPRMLDGLRQGLARLGSR
jgi:hypothetical protein